MGRAARASPTSGKDEGRNPTGTFKARGAAVGVTRLRELGVREVAVSSSGNAGDAWAVYCQRAGIEATIFLPEDAPRCRRCRGGAHGGRNATLRGHNSRGGRLAKALAPSHRRFLPNTFQEPYRVEGKKTMGLEIAEQLGWRMPDVVVYPIGGGVGLVGIWKAFNELLELGGSGPLPRFFVSQYGGCAPIVEAFEKERTVRALGRHLDAARRPARAEADRRFPGAEDPARNHGGAIAVSNDDALAAVRDVMRDGLLSARRPGRRSSRCAS